MEGEMKMMVKKLVEEMEDLRKEVERVWKEMDEIKEREGYRGHYCGNCIDCLGMGRYDFM